MVARSQSLFKAAFVWTHCMLNSHNPNISLFHHLCTSLHLGMAEKSEALCCAIYEISKSAREIESQFVPSPSSLHPSLSLSLSPSSVAVDCRSLRPPTVLDSSPTVDRPTPATTSLFSPSAKLFLRDDGRTRTATTSTRTATFRAAYDPLGRITDREIIQAPYDV